MVDAPAAPTLTVLPASNGLAPRVVVNFESVDSSADQITVTCQADGETRIVRGARLAGVAGSFLIVDYEAAFTECTYRGQVWAAGVASDLGAPATVTVAADDVWLMDPLDPGNNLSVELDAASLSPVSRDTDVEVLALMGRKRPPVQFFGRTAITGTPFVAITETQDDGQTLDGLLDVAPVLIRVPDHPIFQLLPRALYAVLTGSAAWPGWVNNWAALKWQLTVQEVAPQTLDVVIRRVTYQTYMDAFATYADAMGEYATYGDAMANPPGGF